MMLRECFFFHIPVKRVDKGIPYIYIVFFLIQNREELINEN